MANTPASFLGLPSELRNKIYELVVLHQEPINPWAENLTPGLLRANKAIHSEASSLFYSRNVFDFADATPEDILLFLERVGSQNAGYIQHIRIAFPTFLSLNSDDVALEEGSVSILTNIQGRCTNLNTLTTSLESTNAVELRLDNLDNHRMATAALMLVDARFRVISSLQEIIVEVYEDGPSGHFRKEMKRCGWTIREWVEEDDDRRGFSDDDDYDDYDDYGGNDYDDYDIDNDSDFWRRAMD
jgi:hypothetical protein